MASFQWHWFNRPQHPLLRVLLTALGIVLVAGVLVLGFFALIAFAFVGVVVAVVRALTRPHRQSADAARGRDPAVIEGEYVVVRNDPAALKH